MKLKSLLLSSVAAILLAGCSFSTYKTIPFNVAEVSNEVSYKYDEKLETKWIVTEKYQVNALLENHSRDNSYFVQYRGMLDKNNKMKYVKLYISDILTGNNGEVNEIVGNDSYYFNFKLFKKYCNDQSMINSEIPIEEMKFEHGKNVRKIVSCGINSFGDSIDLLKETLSYENTQTLISIPIEQLKEMSKKDYVLTLRYNKIDYKIVIPSLFSEGMYREWFKYQ